MYTRSLLYFLIILTAIAAWQCRQSKEDINYPLANSTYSKQIEQLFSEIKVKNYRGIEAIDLAQQSLIIAQSSQDSILINRSFATLARCIHQQYNDSAFTLLEKSMDFFIQKQLWHDVVDASRYLSIIYEDLGLFDTATYILKHSLILADSIRYTNGAGNAKYNLAAIENKKGENSKALITATEALSYFKIENNLIGQTDVHNLMGIIYDQMGYYPEALDQYLKAKEYSVTLNDIPLQTILANNIGVLHDNLNNTNQALKFYNEALELANLSNDIGNQALLLNNLSYIHLRNHDTLQTFQSLWKSLKLSKQDNFPCFDIYPLEGLIDLHLKKNNIDSAFYYLNYSFERIKVCNDVAIEAPLFKHLGKIKYNQKDYTGAKNALLQSLKISKKAELLSDQKEALYQLFQLNKEFNNINEALYYLETYMRFVDSVDNKKSSEKALAIFNDYEFKKEMEIIENNNKLSELKQQNELSKRRLTNIFSISFLSILLVFVIIVVRLLTIARRRNKKLELLNEEKNTLIGIVSHDLKNPLNLIKGFIGLVQTSRNTVPEEEYNQYLKMMDHSADRMKEIIDRTLDLSEIENLKVTLQLKKLNIYEELEKAKDRFKWLAEEKELQIHWENLSKTSLHIFADQGYLNQIIDNLLSNAIKFSPRKKQIFISLGQNESMAFFSIRDEGPGIPKNEIGDLFKKFTPLSPKPTENESSTGLGLSIVKKYVEAMHGTIEVKSENEKGTAFIISFPKI